MTSDELRQVRSWPLRTEGTSLSRHGIHSLDCLVAATTYDASPLLREAVRRMKYHRIPGLAVHLGFLLSEAAPLLHLWERTVLCPVPLHWTRSFHRGFNQSELLAREVSVRRGIPVHAMLRRTHATGFQSHRSRKDRRRAVRGAFTLLETSLPLHVVLVDDVSTSGATLDACAAVLKAAGAHTVQALVVAQG